MQSLYNVNYRKTYISHLTSPVCLCADQHDGCVRADGPHLGQPLLLHVVVGGGARHAEADQEHVRLGVGQGAQLVELLLAGGVEERDPAHGVGHRDVGGVVLEDGGHVVGGEGVRGVELDNKGSSEGS